MSMYTVKERLYLSEADKIVSEDSPEARWLYATPGTEIPMAEAKRYGLVKAERKPPAKAAARKRAPAAKSQAKPPDKSRSKAANKAKSKDEGK